MGYVHVYFLPDVIGLFIYFSVTFTFGIITMLSGLIGVPLGSYLCQMLRSRYPNIDPIVCGAGLLISAPLLFMASILSNTNVIICYILIFIGEVCMNLNWAIVADILLVSVTVIVSIYIYR